jgi:predicted nuclease of restriction endonuclease-like (RecB) superfamily
MIYATYKSWIVELKSKVRTSQLKAAIAVNSALIEFYWELGKNISEKQTAWGTKFLEHVSNDLRQEFPEMKGFSVTNLKYCKLFYEYILIRPQLGDELVNRENLNSPQLGDELRTDIANHSITQIPWGHIKLIITKLKDSTVANYYIKQTITNGWSRDVLDLQIKSNLHKRQGNSVNNFETTLPKPLSDLANQTLKDPYIFDFLNLDTQYRERDIEKQLIQHIKKFLLELGKGFAFIGSQYNLQIAKQDYFLDLLFYHTKLKCYVVIELKNTRFIPEFAGKLNFYLSAVDSLIKDENDNPTIGILLCKDKNNVEAEFALRGMQKPMGVSEIKLVEQLPENLKASLPTIEELEAELKNE